jgi:membrane fusion protein, multidrug efflux system
MKLVFERTLPGVVRLGGTTVALAALASLAGCGSSAGAGGNSGSANSSSSASGGAKGQQGPLQVGYTVVQPTSVPIVTQLSGRTNSYQTSEVRPQVNGIIRKRYFTEGALVHKGQLLYLIDPSLYKAAVDQAAANLASAKANAESTKIKADRYKPLAQQQAVAQQDYTDALSAAQQAAAAVKQNDAALETARVNLRYTTVPSPITGRIGRSLYTVGALVTASQTDPLAVIQQLDPMYVDIQESSADLLALRRSLAQGGALPSTASVKLQLEDGSDYGFTGTVEFTEVTVDQSTGTVNMRARFPNPQGVLLPGMFVHASFSQASSTNVFLVPQQAVSRDPKGNATLFVVGPDNKAVQRSVTADRAVGPNWVVTKGLQPGDKVITQGLYSLKPNMPINPVPDSAAQQIAPPQGKQANKQASAQKQGG